MTTTPHGHSRPRRGDGRMPAERDTVPAAGVPDVRAPRVRFPVMFHGWRHCTFLHWRYPPSVVQRLLPPGLTVQTWEGSAWVGLLPFLMEGVRPPGLAPLPWLSRFPETNVRTYVRGPDGSSGIWFFSLDAARLPAVTGGRVGYGLPYCWSQMAVRSTGTDWAYRCRRRWPDRAHCDARVRVGDRLRGGEVGPLEQFLTARYRLYSRVAGRYVAANAEHRPWPLHRARLDDLDENLLAAAHLPRPGHDPLVHASPGVRVRIGMWRPA